MAGELDDLKRIVTSLRGGTDNQAAAVLARLRLGESPEDVAKSLPATASTVAPFRPPRYALLDPSVFWRQHDNPVSAYWPRSLRTRLEVETVRNHRILSIQAWGS
jgi:hypothetical protein